MTGFCGLICALAALAHPAPATTPLRISVAPGSVYTDSGVVRRDGAWWLATIISTRARPDTVRIYRWAGVRWSLLGHVALGGSTGPGAGPTIDPASLTGSGVPDFVFGSTGADSHSILVIARLRGRWRTVPFDDGYPGPTAGSWGVRGRLVPTEVTCGCAGGPSTSGWYRFAGARFEPTWAPGPRPACTASALDRARPMNPYGNASDAVFRHLPEPFAATRFACARGWAIATGLRHGRRLLALFEQRGGGWQRDAVGTARQFGVSAGWFDLPRRLLHRLAAEAAASCCPANRAQAREESRFEAEDRAWRRKELRTMPRYLRAVAPIAVLPGSAYAASNDARFGRRTWFAAATAAPRPGAHRPALLTVHVFRWTGRRWSERGTVRVQVRDRDLYGIEATRTAYGGPSFRFDLGPRLVIARDEAGRWDAVRPMQRLGW